MNQNNIGPLIINLDGTSLSKNEKNLIKHEIIGGIILFSHNFVSKNQLKELILDIKNIKDNILVSIDHEGGRVQRLLNGFTHLPSLESISNIENIDEKKSASYDAGFVGASELSEMNIDINYSPVVDIYHNKKNNLLKDRTFGDNPNVIIQLAECYIKGSLDGGILPVLKHFPGHGRVDTDSHIENCVSKIDFNTLSRTDILPFQKLHNSFSDCNIPIMTNHIAYPNIDDYITTYSRKWLIDLSASIFSKLPLFISDDIEMFSAVSSNNKDISCDDRFLLALKAGCRLVIATTMQNPKIIDDKCSYRYFTENYLTKNIIEHYEKIHDNMLEITLPKSNN